jgi:hypothetical protein
MNTKLLIVLTFVFLGELESTEGIQFLINHEDYTENIQSHLLSIFVDIKPSALKYGLA